MCFSYKYQMCIISVSPAAVGVRQNVCVSYRVNVEDREGRKEAAIQVS